MPNGGGNQDPFASNDTSTNIITDKEEEGTGFGAYNSSSEVAPQPQNNQLGFISDTVGGFSFPNGFTKGFGEDTGGIVQGTGTGGTVTELPNATSYVVDRAPLDENALSATYAVLPQQFRTDTENQESGDSGSDSGYDSGSDSSSIDLGNDRPSPGLSIATSGDSPAVEEENNARAKIVYEGLTSDGSIRIGGDFLPGAVSIRATDKLTAEGISQQRPEIVAMTQFHSLFKYAENSDNITNEFLNVVADPTNFKSLPAARLMEIQTYVRNLTSKNTRDILQIFNNRYNSGANGIDDLGEFFSKLVKLNNETRFLDNIKYDIIQDDYEFSEVIQQARLTGNDTQMSSVLNANKDNTYVRMIVRYLIINNLARRFFEILNIVNQYNEDFMLDFYEDVIIGAQIDDSEIKQVFDSRNLSMTSDEHPLRGLFRPDLPNSVNLIRLVKALHASCLGLVNHNIDRGGDATDNGIYNDEQTFAFYNLFIGETMINFLEKGRLLMYEDILGPYRPSTNHNSEVFQQAAVKGNRDTHLDIGIQHDHANNCDILTSLLYDMKLTARDSTTRSSSLLTDHIASSGIQNYNPFLGEDYLQRADIIGFLAGNSVGGYPNLSPSGVANTSTTNFIYPGTHVGNLIYKASETQPGGFVLMVDGQNGLVAAEAESSNLVTASDEFFNVESIAAGELAEGVATVRENVEAIIDDIKNHYGLININQNASYPKNYVENFCDKLAGQLEKIKIGGTADKATLLQALLLTRAGENFDFCFDLFVATLGIFHEKNYGTGSKDVYTQEGLTGPEGLVEESAPIKDYTQAAILQAKGEEKETISSAGFNDRFENSNGFLYPTAFDKVFVHYYRYLMPASKMTIGDNDDSYRFEQVFVDSAYKNKDSNVARTYDGNYTEYLWDEEEDKQHISVGNDDFIEVTKPASATDQNDFCKHENFNATFETMIRVAGSDSQLIELPFAYDKEFLTEISPNPTNISVDSLNNVVTVGGYRSSNLTRIYKLFKIMCNVFRNSFSFSVQADGLGDEKDNSENNRARKVRIYYNGSMIVGAIDGLRGGKDENEDYFDQAMYDNDADTMYKNAYNYTLNSFRNYMLKKIKRCDDRSIILAAALSKLSNYYRVSLEGYSSAFSSEASQLILSSYLDYIGDARSIFNFYNQDQFALASITHKRLMFPSLVNYFLPNGKDITSNQLKCMYKYFSCRPDESDYRNHSFVLTSEESLKQRQKKLIFHIGIPNGLVQMLRKEALDDIGFDNLSFQQQSEALTKSRASSIIKIRLYKRDLLNPTGEISNDIMVQEYLFDMRKFFIDGLDHDEVSNSIYTFAANNVAWKNFVTNHFFYQVNSDLSLSRKKLSNINSISDIDDGTINLTSGQKSELIGNHLNDYYLKLYCKTMLGIDYDEDIYQFFDVRNETLRRGPDPGLGQNTYESAFLSPLQQVIQLTENNYAYLKERSRIASEGERSVFFSGRKYFERTINPKLFDRVFSVFVNLHDLDEVSHDKISLDQFYCSVTLTQLKLDFEESDSSVGADLVKVNDSFQAKHGTNTLPGKFGKQSRL